MPTKSLLTCAAFLTMSISALCATLTSAAVISPQLQSSLAIESSDPIPAIIILTATETPAMLARRLGPHQRGQIISELENRAEFNRSNLVQFLRQRNIENIRPLWLINGVAVTAPADVLLETASLPSVQAITLDETLQLPHPLDSTDITAEWNISRTGAPQLWDMGFVGTGITIAILDSGVNINHPDLINRWRGLPGDWFDPYNNSTTPYDFGIFHGTGVAGVALGGNSSGNSIGMAPGAQLIAAKLFRDDGSGNVSYIIEALQWVLNPGGDPDQAPAVINNSWGFIDSDGECLATLGTGQNALHLRSAIETVRAAGIVVVSSAGNTGPADDTSISPANFPESLAVGATDFHNSIAGFSSRGPSACLGDSTTYPDLVAPGVSVKVAADGSGTNAGYQFMSGTSFSSPHVTGAVALLLSAVDDLSVNELETALKDAAIDLGPSGVDNTYGHGLLDVARALFLIDENLFPDNPLLTLIGTIPDPTDATTEVLDFGFLVIDNSTEKTVELRNNGGGELEISDIANGLNPPFAMRQNNCNDASLGAGESCGLVLEFSTNVPGDYTDEVLIKSNDEQRPHVLLQLTGYAGELFPELTVTPAAISFGQIVPGTSVSRKLVLENKGTAAVENISIGTSELADPFSIEENTCRSILEPEESCSVEINFAPDQVGSFQGQIAVRSSDPEAENVLILISGTSNTPPTRPELISPIAGTVLSSTDAVTLIWQESTDPDGDEVIYTVVLADNPDLNNPLIFSGITLLLGLAFLGVGVSPHNRKIVLIILSVSLLWLNSCGGGGGGGGSSSSGSATTTVNTLSQTVGPLSAGTYYWKVIAEDGRGGISASDHESFVVE